MAASVYGAIRHDWGLNELSAASIVGALAAVARTIPLVLRTARGRYDFGGLGRHRAHADLRRCGVDGAAAGLDPHGCAKRQRSGGADHVPHGPDCRRTRLLTADSRVGEPDRR